VNLPENQTQNHKQRSLNHQNKTKKKRQKIEQRYELINVHWLMAGPFPQFDGIMQNPHLTLYAYPLKWGLLCVLVIYIT